MSERSAIPLESVSCMCLFAEQVLSGQFSGLSSSGLSLKRIVALVDQQSDVQLHCSDIVPYLTILTLYHNNSHLESLVCPNTLQGLLVHLHASEAILRRISFVSLASLLKVLLFMKTLSTSRSRLCFDTPKRVDCHASSRPGLL